MTKRIVIAWSIVLLLLRFANCAFAESSRTVFPRALVRTEDVAAAIRTEWELRANYEVLPQDGAAWFITLEGASNVPGRRPRTPPPR